MARLLVLVIIIAAVAAGIYYMGPMQKAQVASVGDAYSDADTLYMKSEYASAIATYEKALAKSPGDSRGPEARFRIADSYEKSDKPGAAAKAYKDFAAAYPNDERMNKVQKRIAYLTDTGAH